MTDGATTGAVCVDCEGGADPFFCGLSKKGANHTSSAFAARVYSKGELLFVEGQAARGVYLLCQGRVKLSACSGGARALITDITQPGDVLGLSAAISGKPYEATAEALEPCRLIFVRRDDFLRLLDEHAAAWTHVSRLLCRSYRAVHRQAVILGLSPSAAGKLASVLLERRAHNDRRSGRDADVALTHEELGQIIGSSRETVTRLLNDFKRKRIVEVSGATIRVRDRLALEALALAS